MTMISRQPAGEHDEVDAPDCSFCGTSNTGSRTPPHLCEDCAAGAHTPGRTTSPGQPAVHEELVNRRSLTLTWEYSERLTLGHMRQLVAAATYLPDESVLSRADSAELGWTRLTMTHQDVREGAVM